MGLSIGIMEIHCQNNIQQPNLNKVRSKNANGYAKVPSLRCWWGAVGGCFGEKYHGGHSGNF